MAGTVSRRASIHALSESLPEEVPLEFSVVRPSGLPVADADDDGRRRFLRRAGNVGAPLELEGVPERVQNGCGSVGCSRRKPDGVSVDAGARRGGVAAADFAGAMEDDRAGAAERRWDQPHQFRGKVPRVWRVCL